VTMAKRVASNKSHQRKLTLVPLAERALRAEPVPTTIQTPTEQTTFTKRKATLFLREDEQLSVSRCEQKREPSP
jgi:hypothetical protein